MRAGAGLRGTCGFSLLVLAVVTAVYWPVLRSPYVQDDWATLEWCLQGSCAELLGLVFDPAGKLLYRPLTPLYLRALHACAGESAVPHHLIGLLALGAGAVLARTLLRTFVRDPFLASCAALTQAALALVHHESILWGVGIQDLLAPVAVTATVLLARRGAVWWAAAALAAGLTCKEGVAVALALIPLVSYAAEGPSALRPRTLARLWPLALVGAAYTLVKALGTSPFSLAREHPYASALLGDHVLLNVLRYAAWTGEAVLAVGPAPLAWCLFAALCALALLPARGPAPRDPQGRRDRPWLLLAWSGCALLPFLVLRHHAFRGYLAMALPALTALAWLGLAKAASRVGAALVRPALALATALTCSLSVLALQGLVHEPHGPRSSGSNRLVAKAQTVAMLRPALAARAGALPAGATLVLEHDDALACGGSAGPRAWTGDPTLTVKELGSLQRDATGAWHAADGTALDPARTRWLLRRGGEISFSRDGPR